MKNTKNPFSTKVLLWWVALISLAISGALYYFLGEQAKYDVALAQKRILFPVIGIIIAGICAISGSAGRWFYPK